MVVISFWRLHLNKSTISFEQCLFICISRNNAIEHTGRLEFSIETCQCSEGAQIWFPCNFTSLDTGVEHNNAKDFFLKSEGKKTTTKKRSIHLPKRLVRSRYGRSLLCLQLQYCGVINDTRGGRRVKSVSGRARLLLTGVQERRNLGLENGVVLSCVPWWPRVRNKMLAKISRKCYRIHRCSQRLDAGLRLEWLFFLVLFFGVEGL